MFLQRDFGSCLASVAHAGQADPGHKASGVAECAMGSEDKRNIELISKASFSP